MESTGLIIIIITVCESQLLSSPDSVAGVERDIHVEAAGIFILGMRLRNIKGKQEATNQQ